MSFHKALAREQGQTLVLGALMMVALVGFLALVIDVGAAYSERRHVQNAADAGALAGARALALNQEPGAAVHQYAVVLNGAQSVETAVVTPTVTVTATKVCRTYFASILGAPSYTVRATAQARYSPASSWDGSRLMPIATHKDKAIKGVQSLIWDSDTEDDGPKDPDDYPPGWDQSKDNLIKGAQRGWLDLNNVGDLGNDDLKTWIQYGYRETIIHEGDNIQGDPGSRSSAIQNVHDYRLNTTVIVPLYDSMAYIGGGKATYHVCGFAAFLVTSVNWKGNFKYVAGYFIDYVATEDQRGEGSYSAGVQVVELLK